MSGPACSRWGCGSEAWWLLVDPDGDWSWWCTHHAAATFEECPESRVVPGPAALRAWEPVS